jgi:hypothetical protein
VFGPRKSLFSHIQWSNKLVSFETLKIILFIYQCKLSSGSFLLKQYADITAAIGLCLEKMSKRELEMTKDVLNCILQGVTCKYFFCLALAYQNMVSSSAQSYYLLTECCFDYR